ncbi:MAG: hypothetical protein ACUVRD_09080 [Bacteroidia bacterium]
MLWLAVWLQSLLPIKKILWNEEGKVFFTQSALLPVKEGYVEAWVYGGDTLPWISPETDLQVDWQRDFYPVSGGTPSLCQQRGNLRILFDAQKDIEEVEGVRVFCNDSLICLQGTQRTTCLPVRRVLTWSVLGTPLQLLQPAWRLKGKVPVDTSLYRLSVENLLRRDPWVIRFIWRMSPQKTLYTYGEIYAPGLPFDVNKAEVYFVHGNGGFYFPEISAKAYEPLRGRLWQGELAYQDVYQVRIPLLHPAPRAETTLSVRRSLQVSLPTEKLAHPASGWLFGQEGNFLGGAQWDPSPTGKEAFIHLLPTQNITVTAVENEQRPDRTPKNPLTAPYQGKIFIQNTSPDAIRLTVEKVLRGKITRSSLASITPLPTDGSEPLVMLTWEVYLRPYSQEVLEYGYEAIKN